MSVKQQNSENIYQKTFKLNYIIVSKLIITHVLIYKMGLKLIFCEISFIPAAGGGGGGCW